MFNPQPLILFGQTALCDPVTDPLGVDKFSATSATLVGEAVIEWGRGDHWTQPEPASIRFSFWDPGDTAAGSQQTTWPIKIATQNAVGIGVRVSIDLPTGHGIAEAVGGTYVIFQGFTTKVEAERRRVLTVDGWRWGWLVTVVAADRTSSLGNVPFTFEDWPAQRMIDRAIELRNRAAGIGIRQFYFDADHVNGTVGPLEVRDWNGLDVAQNLYASFGHQWTYHPNRNVVIRIPEHRFPDSPRLTEVAGRRVIPTMPDLTDWTGTEDAIDRAPHVGTYVDGCRVEGEVKLSSDQLSYITQAEVKWKNRHDNYRTIITRTTKLFATAPYRTLTFESWFDDGITVDPILNRAAEKAFYQESGPHHPAITYRTKPFGGFENVRQAIWFLTPAERRGYAFLAGSPWIADLGGVPPIVTPAGGTIVYSGGEWTVTAKLLRGHRTSVGSGLKWNTNDASISWADNGQRSYAEAVTWADLWFVRDGAIYN